MDCEAQICPDLVGATIIEHRVVDPSYSCDSFVNVPVDGVDGCMQLNITTGVCTIYVGFKADLATRNHEMSHCHGWQHTWNRLTHRYEWFPMPELEMYGLGDRRPIGKDAGT